MKRRLMGALPSSLLLTVPLTILMGFYFLDIRYFWVVTLLVFIQAMVDDIGSSKVSHIAKRMEKDSKYVSLYRSRLIKCGVIKDSGFGQVSFAFPYMRDFLLEKKLLGEY